MPRRRRGPPRATPTQIDGLRLMLSGLLGELARAGTQDEIWDATVERVSQAARTCDGMPTPGTYTGPVAHKGLLRYHEEACLLYTSDAADDLLCVDLGGRRIIKKKT